MTKTTFTMALGAALLWTGTVLAAPTAQEKCDSARIKAWRKYASCVQLILAKDAAELPINPSRNAAFTKCRSKYFKTWNKLQGGAYAGSTCIGSRFTDNGDGTVTDNLSTLTWEKKIDLDTVLTLDPRDADHDFDWSTDVKEDGTVFNAFLLTLNTGTWFAGAAGWRLPTLAELQTIVLDFPCTATSCNCPSSPCIDPALDASNTQVGSYWSATSNVPSPYDVWNVDFLTGGPFTTSKTNTYFARAVRGGM